MSPKKKLDKRLYAAKIIGIILLVTSIIGFSSNIIAALMSMFMFPEMDQISHIHHANKNFPIIPEFIGWIFSHYTVLSLSFSIIWIPMFFGARALNKFKEWGRKVCVIYLILMAIFMQSMGFLFFSVNEIPAFMTFFMVIVYGLYAATFLVGAYFLMRRSTREGIRDHNMVVADAPEPAPVIPPPVEAAPVVTPPVAKDPRLDLAKRVVADVKDVPLPKKRKNAALIVAGIMMIVLPAFWFLFSLVIALQLNGLTSFIALLNLIATGFTLVMGVAVIWHIKKNRLMAVLGVLSCVVLMIIQLHEVEVAGILFLCSYYVAILVLLGINYNKFHEDEPDEDASMAHLPLSPMKMETQELNLLAESKAKGEISETEFEQKTIEIKVKCRSLDLAASLLKRRNNGMLTEEDYQSRLEKLRLEKQAEVEMEMLQEKEQKELHTQRLSLIAPERIEKLTLPNRSRLDKYIDLMETTDIIVYHDQQIKLIHADRWSAIQEAGTQDQFEIILQLPAKGE
jgi:MFS family permease